ncbi:hypothetical protein EC957_007184 [Mortierella hygrophila]|uniref:SH3 domain-containing protein n=1 Tax=Mortierella hygrophila TaxID=979708 RepID=A0A9P6K6F1_9FUNG|nr:hypothetical protein EC957_007184 [Mortierella hygrophila]
MLTRTIALLSLIAAAATSATAAPAATASVCTVNDNGVNYRAGPGPNYQAFGTVNRGQNLNYRGRTGDWIMGDLWGGRTVTAA